MDEDIAERMLLRRENPGLYIKMADKQPDCLDNFVGFARQPFRELGDQANAVIGSEARMKEPHQLIEQPIRVDAPGKPHADKAELFLEWRLVRGTGSQCEAPVPIGSGPITEGIVFGSLSTPRLEGQFVRVKRVMRLSFTTAPTSEKF